MSDTPRLPAGYDTDRSREPDGWQQIACPRCAQVDGGLVCQGPIGGDCGMVTDTPATTPATTANMLVDWPLGMAGREFYESGFRDGHAAGVAAERQRLRQWTIDHHATWGAIVRQFPAAIADLLAGGGQDT